MRSQGYTVNAHRH